MSVDNTFVTLSTDNLEEEVTITNEEIEEYEESEDNSEDESEEKTTTVQTGDNSPIGMYVFMFAAAGFVLLETERRRRKDAQQ